MDNGLTFAHPRTLRQTHLADRPFILREFLFILECYLMQNGQRAKSGVFRLPLPYLSALIAFFIIG